MSEANLERAAKEFRYGGYAVETCVVNALEKDSVEAFAQKAAALGEVMYFIDTAGASPNQASAEHILALDMVGTGYAVDAFGKVMAKGGAGLIVASQTGYMYPIPNDVELRLLQTPTEKLMDDPFIRETAMQRSGVAYMIAKARQSAAGTKSGGDHMEGTPGADQHHQPRRDRYAAGL